MEEADALLLVQLNNLGFKLGNLEEFEAESMTRAARICFMRIHSMLSEDDQFIDIDYL